jgi:hypothetical protein
MKTNGDRPDWLRPTPGQKIHLSEINQYDLTGFRFSWDAENFATVREITQDEINSAVRCSAWRTCAVADFCCAGKPHRASKDLDSAQTCFDHKPYIAGGIVVWGELVKP